MVLNEYSSKKSSILAMHITVKRAINIKIIGMSKYEIKKLVQFNSNPNLEEESIINPNEIIDRAKLDNSFPKNDISLEGFHDLCTKRHSKKLSI